MHSSRYVFVISDEARCIKVQYDPNDKSNTSFNKTMDQSITVDDMVVLETDSRHKMTIGKVIEVDIEPDLESSVRMNWVYQKIDNDAIKSLRDQEAEAVDTVKKLERKKKRRELRQEWMGDNGHELRALPIYSGDDQHPATPIKPADMPEATEEPL